MKQINSELTISENSSIKEAMKKIEANAARIIFVSSSNEKILGSLTDGDIRRYLLQGGQIENSVKEAMNRDFRFVNPDSPTGEILRLMDMGFQHIPVVNSAGEMIKIYDKSSMAVLPKVAKTYHGRAPARVSFCGGGSDTTAFSSKARGAVLNASIKIYAHSVLKIRSDKKIKILSFDLNDGVTADNFFDLIAKKEKSNLGLVIALI